MGRLVQVAAGVLLPTSINCVLCAGAMDTFYSLYRLIKSDSPLFSARFLKI